MPITLRLPVPLSDEELIAFSRRNKPYRIERNNKGELEILSPLGLESGQREAWVMARLAVWAEVHGGVAFSSNAGFTLADGSVRSPDASWVSDAHWNALSREDQEGFGHISPDFLVEVLSKSDSRLELERKMEMWIANGAQLAWMIDPFARTVSVYQPSAAVDILTEPDTVVAGSVVAGFRLEMAKLWSR